MIRKIKIELLEGGVMPMKATFGSAAYDVYISKDVDMVLEYGERMAVPLGFKMELPQGLAAVIQPRSGFSLKGMAAREWDGSRGRRLNADVLIGLIDSDYRGEVHAIIRANDSIAGTIPEGTRIAQMRIVTVPDTELVGGIVNGSGRGKDGFGSTGIR